ncbi:hypothetical protein PPERSA_09642 [Pseudocohnilembus persalinus]|uniref:Uncharacterized protein n=1 Tax=Pseudocohnilembus persalinus TaxID=266149 RepID=A0A0V0QFU1_PSEPJ|nr:hypothetical protein PPERSA_09642 [Pseudocohnilembus persalinus]|eukprot:KRX01036.1 hypothetical protein PPERSA_09642 [Pseudocohnilembus persalinus]
MAIVQQNMRTSKYDNFKNLSMEEKLKVTEMQEGDKNRLTKAEQIELIQKIQEQGIEQYSNIIGDEKPKTALDLKIQYLQTESEKGDMFSDMVKKDQQNAIEHYEAGSALEQAQNRKIEKSLQLDSFGRQDKQLAKFIEKYRLDQDESMESMSQIELFRDLQKDELFQKKQIQEENQKYKEYLEKKQRIKEFKQYEKQLNETPFRDNLDYDDESQVKVTNKIKKDKELGIIDTDHIDKLNQMEQNTIYDHNSFDFHKIRTENNVSDYITQYFGSDKAYISSLFYGQQVVMEDVYMNDGLTVVYIFWNFSILSADKTKVNQQLSQEQYKKQQAFIPKIQAKLDKHANFLSGKLCKNLGFKYGPQIRFYKSEITTKENESRQELQKTLPDVIKKVLLEDLQLKKISKKDYDYILDRYTDRAMEQLQGEIGNLQQLYKIKSKKRGNKKIEYDENGKIIRNNRNPDGSRKKYKKTNKAKNFWDGLQA